MAAAAPSRTHRNHEHRGELLGLVSSLSNEMSTLEKGNLFSSLPDALHEEQFENLLELGRCRIERIVSQGQSSPEGYWYDQPRDEWVVLLRGQAMLEFSEPGQRMRLEEGDYVMIPAHCRHRVAWTDPNQPTIWLAIHV